MYRPRWRIPTALGLAAVLSAVVAAALAAAGCDRTPTAPSVVVDLGPPWIVALWIEPGEMFELEIGEEKQLTACVEYSDVRRDCEIEAEWLTDGAEASVVNGLVRGELPGWYGCPRSTQRRSVASGWGPSRALSRSSTHRFSSGFFDSLPGDPPGPNPLSPFKSKVEAAEQ